MGKTGKNLNMEPMALRLVLKHLAEGLRQCQDDAEFCVTEPHWNQIRRVEFRAEAAAFAKAVKMVQSFDLAARRAGYKKGINVPQMHRKRTGESSI